MFDELHTEIDRYYSRRVIRYGPTPLGVDWSCVPSQELRFVQLLKICGGDPRFSLNDLGCGYGALLGFIAWRHPEWDVDYLGIDLSAPMVEQARRLWRRRPQTAFQRAPQSPRHAGYSVASGIFNVCLGFSVETWEHHVAQVIKTLDATSSLGFSVNFLRSDDPGASVSRSLYRASPAAWAGFCRSDLGRQVDIVEGYGMREFTLLVRR